MDTNTYNFVSLCFLTQIFSLFAFLSDKHSIDESYIFHLSTKTSYRFIENIDDSEIHYDGCVPKRIWSVIRHGTRTPGPETAESIRTRLLTIRDLIVSYSRNSEPFRKWKPHRELDDQKRLTKMGQEEMLSLGKRFRNRFPNMLSSEWSNETYLFRYTDTSRTKASALHFSTGLFGKKMARQIWFPTPLKKDPILRFYKLCERWRKSVKKNPESLVELNKFLVSDVFEVVIQNITKKLELPDGVLNSSDINLMYTTCCFETAWDKEYISPWCSLFSVDEFKVLEYAEDLQYYWIDGYGSDLTTKIPCVMLKDAIAHLKSREKLVGKFYFTHSGTILKFLSHLGLYRDEPKLRHDNFHLNENRQWKTSGIDVFGSNIALILFDCVDGEHVLTLHQERPVKLPGCPDTDLCPLHRVQRIYKDSLLNCDFENMCTVNKNDYYQYFIDLLWHSVTSIQQLYL